MWEGVGRIQGWGKNYWWGGEGFDATFAKLAKFRDVSQPSFATWGADVGRGSGEIGL
jgi:hypothetical protein